VQLVLEKPGSDGLGFVGPGTDGPGSVVIPNVIYDPIFEVQLHNETPSVLSEVGITDPRKMGIVNWKCTIQSG
jgi:hypothetical protein